MARLPYPSIQSRPGGKGWQVMEPYTVTACGLVITVLAGYVTDGESSPRLAYTLFGHPLDPEALPQAVPHDALYQSGRLTRQTADEIWLDVARQNGMGPVERRVKYAALRSFGWIVWNRARRNTAGESFARRHLQIKRAQ